MDAPIRRALRTALGRTLVLGSLIALPFSTAQAGSHTWNVNEIFSDSTGNIQFIELVEANGTPNEVGVPGHSMTSNTKNFVISGPALAPPTSNKFYLIATSGFAALAGAPTPDAIIPPGVLPFFFSTGGDTVTYVPWDAFSFASVPTDGTTSLNANLTTGLNSPTNYAGVSGSVNASPPPAVPMLSEGALLLLAGLPAATAAGTAIRLRARA
jgi:hypothetical protein